MKDLENEETAPGRVSGGGNRIRGMEEKGVRGAEGGREIRAANRGSIRATEEFGWLSILLSFFFSLSSSFHICSSKRKGSSKPFCVVWEAEHRASEMTGGSESLPLKHCVQGWAWLAPP